MTDPDSADPAGKKELLKRYKIEGLKMAKETAERMRTSGEFSADLMASYIGNLIGSIFTSISEANVDKTCSEKWLSLTLGIAQEFLLDSHIDVRFAFERREHPKKELPREEEFDPERLHYGAAMAAKEISTKIADEKGRFFLPFLSILSGILLGSGASISRDALGGDPKAPEQYIKAALDVSEKWLEERGLHYRIRLEKKD